jgi:hypothetical protein
MPGETGVTVVTMLACFFTFAREAAGASDARHSLRPQCFEGEGFMHNSGAVSAAGRQAYVACAQREE